MRTEEEIMNKPRVPTIACFNIAKTPLGVDLDLLIAAMQKYVDECVVPVWGTPARLVKSRDFVKGAWAMVFLEGEGVKDAEGIHDLTPDGLPLAKIYVKPTLSAGDLVSVTASHELVEMLVDPAINMTTTGPDRLTIYSYESADPVEEVTFKVNDIEMSDFVYPAYFETFHKSNSVQFDHARKVRKPFQILSGGYQQIFKRGRWNDVAGSKEKAKRFAKEDRRGHRTVQRKKRKLLPSTRRRT
jgi:hypothetical protein